jgi:DNA-binding MarR family transcriptional regulator
MTPPKTNPGAREDALFEVILATMATFFRLRAWGRRRGAVSSWGGGTWGVLRTLRREGPCTVPQIARSRPVARQRIQRLANELARDGLIAFEKNPQHRRSKLLRLTPAGEAAYDQLTAKLRRSVGVLAADLDPADLRATLRTLEALRERLDAELRSS